MHVTTVSGIPRLLRWRRVRRYAVPPSMIESATARRAVGDWAGACAAARVDVDLNLRTVARTWGRKLAAQVRDDLRHLAPDLLRWHMPRVAPDGLLRPGLTMSLARYEAGESGTLHLVVRTAPAWADAEQRIRLALWDGSKAGVGEHPHPRPDRRFRLDLHRHLWDVRRVEELADRCGARQWFAAGDSVAGEWVELLPPGGNCAVHRWAAEAAILLRAEGHASGVVVVRLGAGRRLLLEVDARSDATNPPRLTVTPLRKGSASVHPVLPDAATWVPPDLELLRAGLIEPDQLHPLVAPVLVPGHRPANASRAGPGTTPRTRGLRLVECRGQQHRIGLVNGVLTPLDHDPTELRREELLFALGGTPLPCLRAIDEVIRQPEELVDIRARLDHGDVAGALDCIEDLLGSDVVLRHGPLKDELEAAVRRRVTHGLFRAGLVGRKCPPPLRDARDRRRFRTRPRHAAYR